MIDEKDEIYHLGDVIFKRAGDLGNILSSLPGIKYLTKGNHDHNKNTWYMNKGFIESRMFMYVEYKGYKILLSHIPQDIVEKEKEFGPIDFNIHGHFHRVDRAEPDRGAKGYPFYSDKHVALSIEELDYKPIEIIDFLTLKNKI